ncbi:acVLRF1 family peptidyl-tRNA hydrolase [Cryptosporangium sp. NPDC048952]|uniref:acVLRF1 family peptidyl-tRNA hydrolase n=1 Tax=Cryptosporangium sp. NPDC048952 TaxID=3363961 RepID=UPI003716040E
MASRPAAGGGRWVDVPPERLERWLAGFTERHGLDRVEPGGSDAAAPSGADSAGSGDHDFAAPSGPEAGRVEGGRANAGGVQAGRASVVTVYGVDGAVAECHPPFPPLAIGQRDPVEVLLAHAERDRRVGVLLVRLGGYAAGIFEGTKLVASKVDTRQVHGRNKAGGWSQQRFARRREGQARQLTEAAAAVAERVLLPELDTLDAIVLGGDKAAVDAALTNLAPLRERAVERFLTVPDPRRTILEATPQTFRAVVIRVAP